VGYHNDSLQTASINKLPNHYNT